MKVFFLMAYLDEIFSLMFSIPSNPEIPWTSGAVSKTPTNGLSEPWMTITSSLPISHRIFNVFWVVF